MPAEPVVSLPALLAVLNQRRRPLLATILLVPLAALVAMHQIAPRYTASGTLICEAAEYKLPELQSILRAEPVNETVMASQAEIIRGRRVVERVAQQLGLFDKPAFNPALRPPSLTRRVLARARAWFTAPAPPALPGPRIDDDRIAVLLAVQNAFAVMPLKNSRVLQVSFTSEDRVLAAAAVNAAMDIYVKDQLGAKYRAVRRATEWLEARVAELRRQVGEADARIAAYRAQQGLVQGMHAGLDAEQVSYLTEALVRARSDLAAAEGRLDAARGTQGAAAQAAIAPSVVQARARQTELAAQLESLLNHAGPRHPDVLGLRTQLAEADRAIATESARVVAATDAAARAARAQVATLERSLDAAQQAVDRGASAQVPLNAMLRDEEASRALLRAVLEGIQATAQQAAVESPDAHEISLALPPMQPSFPRTGPTLAAAGVAGLLLGVLLVYVLELTDTRLRDGKQVRALLGLPCFALIPELRRRQLRGGGADEFGRQHPRSAFAGQLRALRAALALGPAAARIVAITAGRPAEGKTTVALALARVAAAAGERVLAIDCDIRQPGFAGRFQAAPGPGLAECLRGEATLDAARRTDATSGLHYLLAGRSDSDLGRLLEAPAADLLRRLRAEYDLILLDTPPAAALTDTIRLAALADVTVLCVRWRSTPREIVLHALERLEDAHATVAGVVLTRVDPRAHMRSGAADAEVYHRRYHGYFREH